jgi:hypothetical protein
VAVLVVLLVEVLVVVVEVVEVETKNTTPNIWFGIIGA